MSGEEKKTQPTRIQRRLDPSAKASEEAAAAANQSGINACIISQNTPGAPGAPAFPSRSVRVTAFGSFPRGEIISEAVEISQRGGGGREGANVNLQLKAQKGARHF